MIFKKLGFMVERKPQDLLREKNVEKEKKNAPRYHAEASIWTWDTLASIRKSSLVMN